MITWLIVPFWLFWLTVLGSGNRPTYKHDSSWQSKSLEITRQECWFFVTPVYHFWLCKQMHLCTHLTTPVRFEWHWQQAKSSLSSVSKFSSICAVENKEYYSQAVNFTQCYSADVIAPLTQLRPYGPCMIVSKKILIITTIIIIIISTTNITSGGTVF